MTDKNIKDYCKNCDVEPPAMKFKCPECEYNLNNENNFEKDINVPSKEINDSLKNQDKNFNEKFTQEKEQILLKDINETGFYCAVDDTERLYLYEVINNTNKEWLKKDSQAKLLIDEWIYDYTDYDDRKVYFTSGNLEATYNNISTGKVYKIEDTKFKIYGKCGQFLVEDKLTYKEQLARKTAECELLETQLESYHIGEVKLVQRNQELEHIDPLLDPYFRGLSCPEIAELAKKSIRLTEENRRLEEALDEIEVIANEGCDLPCLDNHNCNSCNDKLTNYGNTCMQNAINRIIQKVKQVKKLSNNGVIMGILKDLAASRGLTLYQLAKAADIDHRYIYHWDKEHYRPKVQNLLKISHALNIDINSLIQQL